MLLLYSNGYHVLATLLSTDYLYVIYSGGMVTALITGILQ